MKGARHRKKRFAYFGPCTLGHIQRTINRGINLLVALYDALLLSRLLVSKPHTKSMQQRFILHEHCSMPDLARSTHMYMHVSRESDFDVFESNNFQFFILACIVRLG